MSNKKHNKKIIRHEHWFAEWWSGILLLLTGIYSSAIPNGYIIHHSFVDGFLRILPPNIWECLFIITGIIQLNSLLYENFIGRGIAAFLASILFCWGFINTLVYSNYWHASLIAWGLLTIINLYALSRILTGVEQFYNEYIQSD